MSARAIDNLGETSRGRGRFRAAVPWGFLGMIALVWAVESAVYRHRTDLAPDFSLEWRNTSQKLRYEARHNKIFCFGDSLVKVGVAPLVLQAQLERRVFNLALGSGQPIASYFVFRRALEAGARPQAVVLDAKWTALAHPYVLNRNVLPEVFGPREFLDLAWTARDPALFGELMLTAVFPSYQSRLVIRQDVQTVLDGKTPPRRRKIGAWVRNWEVNRGAHHASTVFEYQGIVDPNRDAFLIADGWQPNPVVVTYLERFFALAEAHRIPVFWLLPPVVPALQAYHDRNGTDAALTRFARRLQARYPNVSVIDGRHAGYQPLVFIDPTHLDYLGAGIFTDDFAPFVARALNQPQAAPRWNELPPFRERWVGLRLEDVGVSAEKLAVERKQRLRR
jgi:hypothetical protein